MLTVPAAVIPVLSAVQTSWCLAVHARAPPSLPTHAGFHAIMPSRAGAGARTRWRAPAGALVGVAQFARDAADARGPPLVVGRMAINADKINSGVTKWKAVVVLRAWKDHLWALRSKGEPPDALSVAAVNEAAGGEKGDVNAALGPCPCGDTVRDFE